MMRVWLYHTKNNNSCTCVNICIILHEYKFLNSLCRWQLITISSHLSDLSVETERASLPEGCTDNDVTSSLVK